MFAAVYVSMFMDTYTASTTVALAYQILGQGQHTFKGMLTLSQDLVGQCHSCA